MSDAVVQMCSGWCAPAVIYAVIVVISILAVIFDKYSLDKGQQVAMQALVGALFTGLMYYLCSHCHEGLAWLTFTILVIVPFVLGVLALVLIYYYWRNLLQKIKDSTSEKCCGQQY